MDSTPLIIGAHTLFDGADNYLGRLGSTKGRVVCMSADVLRDCVRAGHDGAQRTWHENADLTPQQIVDLQQALPDDVKPKVILITGNEDDWGYGRRAGESVHDWMQRKADKTRQVAAIAYTRGYRRFTFGNWSMGCPDWTDDTIRAEFGAAFRGMYNNQTLDGTTGGTPCEWWYDGHCYVPNATWLYDSRVVPTAIAALDATPSMAVSWWGISVTRRAINPRNGQEMTWQEPSPGMSAVPAGRTLHPWDWFLTRSNFLFWEEMGVGFDPKVRRVFASEGLFDEGGTGGAPAHGYTSQQVNVSILRMMDILSIPIVVNGVQYPQPHRGFAIFTTSRNDSKWSGGYGINFVLSDSGVDVTKWRRG